MKSLPVLHKKENTRKLKFKLGLALSGGGTRGFAHIGVLKAFEEERIAFDCVAGTSIGSLIGALYCANVSVEQMIDQAKRVTRKDVVNRFWINSNSANIANLANRLLHDMTFNELTTPFSAVAVDLVDGQEVVLNGGVVAQAVSASCAVPALFKPVEMNGMMLVDGGLLNNMPADVCRTMGAEIVIGVDLNHHRGEGTTSKKLANTLLACWQIVSKSTMYKGLHNSDVVIEPELKEFARTSLSNIDEMVEEGYRAAKDKMAEIKDLLCIKD
ncbi:MAG: patatin-like phospholipase family protein [Clostridiales bacterium]|nr:patatin-like phospholipase family protein [Clostridiales bacterium]